MTFYEIINWIIWAISLGLIAFVAYLIKRIPNIIQDFLLENQRNIHDNLMEQQKLTNSRKLQVESYFKDIGGQDQKQLFDEWTRRLTYMNDIDNSVQTLSSLMHRTIIYGSDTTVNLMSNMMHHMHEKAEDENSFSDSMFVVYTACIISSLKYDFSGYYVEPSKLIQAYIKDYNLLEDEYSEDENIILNELGHKIGE